jgi:2-dehydro-3-deoxyphosphogluconate aldolase / (4S)-4-hydroxy-2-oxoglutarate aldolase
MKHMAIDQAAAGIRASGMVAVARGRFEQKRLLDMAETLFDAGIAAMEVTLNSTAACSHIRVLTDAMGGRMLIGAGTVLTAEQAEEAVAAGAQFLISPGYDPETVAQARRVGVLHVPGVLTPTEVGRAAADGCALLKLFPAQTVGPDYLKALRAPFNTIDFIPTGGVSAATIPAWRRAGAVAVAAGSTLLSPEISLAELKQRAEAMRRAWTGSADER